jgi:hypothetical protein
VREGGVKVGESFRTSLIFLLTVLTTEDTTSLHKSSTEKNDVNGNTIDMLIDDRIYRLSNACYKGLIVS